MNDEEPNPKSPEFKKPPVELAGFLIPNSNGEILLIHRNEPRKIRWELPGGQVEKDKGETPEKTAVKELKEEVGVKVMNMGQIGEDEFSENGVNYHYVWFWGKILDGEPKPVEEKFDEVEYFSWEKIMEMTEEDLSPNMLRLQTAYEDKKLKLKLSRP